MKRLYSILFAVVVVLCLAPISRAQEDYTIPGVLGFTPVFPNDHGTTTKNGVGFSKNISAPHDGNYWIKLEAYATGEGVQTSTSVPSDVVLVLDVSSSMAQNPRYTYHGQTMLRWEALRLAVTDFVKTLYDNAVNNRSIDSNYAGNRIAIVTYCRNARLITGGWMDIEQVVSKSGDTYSGSLINIINTNNNTDASAGVWAEDGDRSRGTRPDRGLELTIDQLLDGSNAEKREEANLTVVMFTDGYPTDNNATNEGEGSGATKFEPPIANKALYYASIIKQEYDAKIYSIGLISDPAAGGVAQRNYARVTTMMDYLSSNYPSAAFNDGTVDEDHLYLDGGGSNGNHYNGYTSNTSYRGNDIPAPWRSAWNYNNGTVIIQNFTPGSQSSDVDGNGNPINYSKIVNDNESFDSIFEAIASQSGGAAEANLSESTSTVDIVSSSFSLPPDSDVSAIKVFTQPYLFNKTTKQAYWGTETLAPHSTGTYTKKWTDAQGIEHIEEGVKVDGEIEVDEDAIEDNIISISGFDYSNNWCGPIKENGVVVDVHKGYKVIILIPIQMSGTAVGGPGVATNEPGSGIYINGQDEPVVTFDIPEVSLPVNISIKKTDLSKGESAKFLIQRTTLPITSSSSWEYVTSVFLTNRDGENDPVVNIKGLPSTKGETQDYVYRIIEEDWGWSYEFSKATGKGYQYTYDDDGNVISATIVDIVVDNPEGVTTDLFVINPITFENTPETDADKVRHAESKVTNTFWGDGVKRWNDSKSNGRTNN